MEQGELDSTWLKHLAVDNKLLGRLAAAQLLRLAAFDGISVDDKERVYNALDCCMTSEDPSDGVGALIKAAAWIETWQCALLRGRSDFRQPALQVLVEQLTAITGGPEWVNTLDRTLDEFRLPANGPGAMVTDLGQARRRLVCDLVGYGLERLAHLLACRNGRKAGTAASVPYPRNLEQSPCRPTDTTLF